MLRLSEPTMMPEILDGEVPLRFVVVILGPDQPDVSYHEVGRSIATLMTNMVKLFIYSFLSYHSYSRNL